MLNMRTSNKNDFNLIELNKGMGRRRKPSHTIMDEIEEEKRGLVTFFEQNPILSMLGSLLLLPYVLGLFLGFFYFCLVVGVPVSDFLAAFHGTSQLVFWLIGFYLIITFTDVWLLTKKALLTLRV